MVKTSKKIINKKPKKIEEVKKDQGGFSLFSFMSGTKNNARIPVKNNKDDEQENEFEEMEVEMRTSKLQSQKNNEEELQNLSRKKEEFFGSTVFDDDKKVEQDSGLEDDILNVPAFFRRKKN